MGLEQVPDGCAVAARGGGQVGDDDAHAGGERCGDLVGSLFGGGGVELGGKRHDDGRGAGLLAGHVRRSFRQEGLRAGCAAQAAGTLSWGERTGLRAAQAGFPDPWPAVHQPRRGGERG